MFARKTSTRTRARSLRNRHSPATSAAYFRAAAAPNGPLVRADQRRPARSLNRLTSGSQPVDRAPDERPSAPIRPASQPASERRKSSRPHQFGCSVAAVPPLWRRAHFNSHFCCACSQPEVARPHKRAARSKQIRAPNNNNNKCSSLLLLLLLLLLQRAHSLDRLIDINK